jgi:hypothetical protein
MLNKAHLPQRLTCRQQPTGGWAAAGVENLTVNGLRLRQYKHSSGCLRFSGFHLHTTFTVALHSFPLESLGNAPIL